MEHILPHGPRKTIAADPWISGSEPPEPWDNTLLLGLRGFGRAAPELRHGSFRVRVCVIFLLRAGF